VLVPHALNGQGSVALHRREDYSLEEGVCSRDSDVYDRGLVTAPSAAEVTSAAYLAKTPE
jgi:hypothetical protein